MAKKIKQNSEFDIEISQCKDYADIVVMQQCSDKIYIEKCKIKALMAKLILMSS